MKNLKNLKMVLITIVMSMTLYLICTAQTTAFAVIGGTPADGGSTGTEAVCIDPNIHVVVRNLTAEEKKPKVRPCSWYQSTFDFHGSLPGGYRWYDENNIGCQIDSHSERQDGSTCTIKLIRKTSNFTNGVVVATATIPQEGSKHVDFWGINNPNNYRIAFQQPIGRTGHQWGNIEFFSWN